MIYLASPFWSPYAGIRDTRRRRATAFARHLIAQGNVVYCPLTMGHAIEAVKQHLYPLFDNDGWIAYDLRVLRFCTSIAVMQQPGWDVSRGVSTELEYARTAALPVTFYSEGEIAAALGEV